MRYFLACLLVCALGILPAAGAAPTAPITRGDFVLLMWSSHGGVPFDKTAHPFSDVQTDELAQAVAWAYGEGLVQGVGGGLFAPERPLTREECALLLRRDDTRLGRIPWTGDGAAECNDRLEISPWADDSLYRACVTGRLPWRQGRLAPLEPVTIQEAVLLFPDLSAKKADAFHS